MAYMIEKKLRFTWVHTWKHKIVQFMISRQSIVPPNINASIVAWV